MVRQPYQYFWSKFGWDAYVNSRAPALPDYPAGKVRQKESELHEAFFALVRGAIGLDEDAAAATLVSTIKAAAKKAKAATTVSAKDKVKSKHAKSPAVQAVAKEMLVSLLNARFVRVSEAEEKIEPIDLLVKDKILVSHSFVAYSMCTDRVCCAVLCCRSLHEHFCRELGRHKIKWER
jgi:hypothetical protein